MFIQQLRLINFKNYCDQAYAFCPNINFLVGHNGAGKTNVLDAVYLMSYGKSYLNPSDSELIRYGQDFFRIEASLHDEAEKTHEVVCSLQRGRRKNITWDGSGYKRLIDHIGKIPLIIISPNDYILMNGGSEDRRKLLDATLVQTDSTYLLALQGYQDNLEQRNALLKRAGQSNSAPDAELLSIYDRELDRFGHELYDRRKAAVTQWQNDFNRFYEALSGKHEHIELQYQSELKEERLLDILIRQLPKDRILEYTSKGSQRDDLRFVIDNNPARKFASQGQQKSILIALKLAQYNYLRREKGLNPLLLIDDIFDKLDIDRCKNLINLLNNDTFGQIFVTDTDLERMQQVFRDDHREKRFFLIAGGECIETR